MSLNESPKITVLMPVYNGEKYLEDSIGSILNQSYSDFELLIIDDGSTDMSYEKIKSYSDERIRVISNSNNLGLVKSLNKGLRLARGEYIARMDCDDISDKYRLEKQVKFLIQNPDIGVCGTWLKVIGNDYIYNYPEKYEDIITSLLFYSCLGHPSVMIDNEILKENNLRYRNCYAEDYDLWVRLSNVTKLANINEPLVNYRIHESIYRFSNMFSIQQQKASDQIRLNQLNSIGLIPTNLEFEIHKSISERRYQYNLEYRTQVDDWFKKIRSAILKIKSNYSIYSIEKIWTRVLEDIDNGIINFRHKISLIRDVSQIKDIYIWGTGERAKKDFFELKKKNVFVKGFIDNNEKKWGNEFLSRKVLPPIEELRKKNIFIIVSTMYEKEVFAQLGKSGLFEERDYCTLSYTYYLDSNKILGY